jgi:hypothetical protein
MSKLEAKYAQQLSLLSRAGEVLRWEEQVPVELKVNGKKICKYIVDFRVWYTDGREEWVEVKGFMTDVAKLKIKLFEACYPDFTFKVLYKKDI